jgi:hypothetical protein
MSQDLYPQLKNKPNEIFNYKNTVIKVYKSVSYVEIFQESNNQVQRLQMKHEDYEKFKTLLSTTNTFI